MKISLLTIIILAIALSGCSTTSPFVGEWASDELPQPGGTMEAIISDDGTLAFTLNMKNSSDSEGLSGNWSAVSETTIKIDIPNQGSGTGKLLDKHTIQISGEGNVYRMNKKK